MGVKLLLSYIEEHFSDIVDEIPLQQKAHYKTLARADEGTTTKNNNNNIRTILVDGNGFLIEFSGHVQRLLVNGKLKKHFPLHLLKQQQELLQQQEPIDNEDFSRSSWGTPAAAAAASTSNNKKQQHHHQNDTKEDDNKLLSNFFSQGNADQQFLNMAINVFNFDDSDIVGGDTTIIVKFLELFLSEMYETCKLKFVFAFDAPRGIDDWDDSAREKQIRHRIWQKRLVENQKDTNHHMLYAGGKSSSKSRTGGGGGGGGSSSSKVSSPALFSGAVREMIYENSQYDDASFESDVIHLDTEVDEVVGKLAEFYSADFVLTGDTDFIVAPLRDNVKVLLQQRFPFEQLLDFTVTSVANKNKPSNNKYSLNETLNKLKLPAVNRNKLISALGIDQIEQLRNNTQAQSLFLLFAASFTGNDITESLIHEKKRIDEVVATMKKDDELMQLIAKDDTSSNRNWNTADATINDDSSSTFVRSCSQTLVKQSIQSYYDAASGFDEEHTNTTIKNKNKSKNFFIKKTINELEQRKQQLLAASPSLSSSFALFMSLYSEGKIDSRFVPLALHDISYPRPVPYDCNFSTLRESFSQLSTIIHIDKVVRDFIVLDKIKNTNNNSAAAGSFYSILLNNQSPLQQKQMVISNFITKAFHHPHNIKDTFESFPFIETVIWMLHPVLHIEEVALVTLHLEFMMLLHKAKQSSSSSASDGDDSWRRLALSIAMSSSQYFDERPDPRCLELSYLLSNAVGYLKSTLQLFCGTVSDPFFDTDDGSSLPSFDSAFSGTLLHAMYCLTIERSQAGTVVDTIVDENALVEENTAALLSSKSLSWFETLSSFVPSKKTSKQKLQSITKQLVNEDVPQVLSNVAQMIIDSKIVQKKEIDQQRSLHQQQQQQQQNSMKRKMNNNNDDDDTNSDSESGSSSSDDDVNNNTSALHHHQHQHRPVSTFFLTGPSPSLNSRFSTQWIGVLHRDELVDMLDEGEVTELGSGGRVLKTGTRTQSKQASSLLTYTQLMEQQKQKEGADDQKGDDLPIMEFMDNILQIIDRCSTLAIQAATGSGKSTMLPLCLYKHWLKNQDHNDNKPLNVMVTQPRRLAAVSLANRVSELLGEEVGQTIGYRIGGGKEFHCESAQTKIRFVTTGYLLEALLNGSNQFWKGITHIILDEVHERSLQADMLSLVVKQKLTDDYLAEQQENGNSTEFPPSKDFKTTKKVIVMSATLQSALFRQYFSPLASIFDEQEYNRIRALAGDDKDRNEPIAPSTRKFRKPSENSNNNASNSADTAPFLYQYTPAMYAGGRRCHVDEYFLSEAIEKLSSKLPEHVNKSIQAYNTKIDTIKSTNKPPPALKGEMINAVADLALSAIQPGWSVLVFLPGLEEIENCLETIGNIASRASGRMTVRLHALHSIVDIEEQKKIVQPASADECKVVLATNIAETSLTIPDLKIVIDCGMARRMSYDPQRQIRRIALGFCSRSAARQRAGRAGRVTDGVVIRMYNQHHFQNILPEFDESEFLPLEYSVLQVRQHFGNYGPVEEVVKKLIEPPKPALVREALKKLIQWGALGPPPTHDVLDLGKISLLMPVDVSMTKGILTGAAMGCAAEMIVVAAGLSIPRPLFKRPLRSFFENDHEFFQNFANSMKARYHFARNTRSDVHLFLSVYEELAPAFHRNKYFDLCQKFDLAPRQVQTFLKYVQQVAQSVIQIESRAGAAGGSSSQQNYNNRGRNNNNSNKSSSKSGASSCSFLADDLRRIKILAAGRGKLKFSTMNHQSQTPLSSPLSGSNYNSRNDNNNYNNNSNKDQQQVITISPTDHLFPAFRDATSHLCFQLCLSSIAEVVFCMTKSLSERSVQIGWNNCDELIDKKSVYRSPDEAIDVYNRMVIFDGLSDDLLQQTGAAIATTDSEKAQVRAIFERAFKDLIGIAATVHLDVDKRLLMVLFSGDSSSSSSSSSSKKPSVGNYPFSTTNLPSQPVWAPHPATHILAKLMQFVPKPTTAEAMQQFRKILKNGNIIVPLFPPGQPFPPIVQKARSRLSAAAASSASAEVSKGEGISFPCPVVLCSSPTLLGFRILVEDEKGDSADGDNNTTIAEQNNHEMMTNAAASSSALGKKKNKNNNNTGDKNAHTKIDVSHQGFKLIAEKWSMLAAPGTASFHPPFLEHGFSFQATMIGQNLNSSTSFPALHSSTGAFLSVMTGVAVVTSLNQNKDLCIAVSSIPRRNDEKTQQRQQSKPQFVKELALSQAEFDKLPQKKKKKIQKYLKEEEKKKNSTTASSSSASPTTHQQQLRDHERIIVGVNPAMLHPIPKRIITSRGALMTSREIMIADAAENNEDIFVRNGENDDDYDGSSDDNNYGEEEMNSDDDYITTDDTDDDDDEFSSSSSRSCTSDDEEYDPARNIQKMLSSDIFNPYHPANINETIKNAIKSLIPGLVSPFHLLIDVNVILMLQTLSQHPYSYGNQKVHLLKIVHELFDLNHATPEMNDRTLTSEAARNLWPQPGGGLNPKEIVGGKKNRKSNHNNNDSSSSSPSFPKFDYYILSVVNYFDVVRTPNDVNPRDFPEIKIFDVEKLLDDLNEDVQVTTKGEQEENSNNEARFSSQVCPAAKWELWNEVKYVWKERFDARNAKFVSYKPPKVELVEKKKLVNKESVSSMKSTSPATTAPAAASSTTSVHNWNPSATPSTTTTTEQASSSSVPLALPASKRKADSRRAANEQLFALRKQKKAETREMRLRSFPEHHESLFAGHILIRKTEDELPFRGTVKGVMDVFKQILLGGDQQQQQQTEDQLIILRAAVLKKQKIMIELRSPALVKLFMEATDSMNPPLIITPQKKPQIRILREKITPKMFAGFWKESGLSGRVFNSVKELDDFLSEADDENQNNNNDEESDCSDQDEQQQKTTVPATSKAKQQQQQQQSKNTNNNNKIKLINPSASSSSTPKLKILSASASSSSAPVAATASSSAPPTTETTSDFLALISGISSSVTFASLRRACASVGVNVGKINFSEDHQKAIVEVEDAAQVVKLISSRANIKFAEESSLTAVSVKRTWGMNEFQ